jgi:hypothetical protein
MLASSPFFSGYCEDRVLLIISLGWPQIMILPILVSQVARTTGVNNWHPAISEYFLILWY